MFQNGLQALPLTPIMASKSAALSLCQFFFSDVIVIKVKFTLVGIHDSMGRCLVSDLAGQVRY